MNLLLIIHLTATLAMAGVIWSVQCIQYPLFGEVGSAQFARYHQAHVTRIGRVVGPLMLAEVATALALVGFLRLSPEFIVALGMLGVAWLSTLLIQVPIHRKLSAAWSADDLRSLVRGNWIRTWAWTARSALLLVLVAQGLK